jgi:hypothetical protein
MIKKTEIRVKHMANSTVTVEVIAESIVQISSGIKVLRAGKLNDKALFLLIQHACPTSGAMKKPSAKEIKMVLDGIASLEEQYLKKGVGHGG